jgi:hypothetical protein
VADSKRCDTEENEPGNCHMNAFTAMRHPVINLFMSHALLYNNILFVDDADRKQIRLFQFRH